MSNFCVIPGCQSHQYIKTATLFSVSCTPALEQWWKGTPWNLPQAGLSDPKVCVAHFRDDQLDRRERGFPRPMPNAVPCLRLPKGPATSSMGAPPAVQVCNPLLIVCRFCSKKQANPIRNHLEDLVESEELLQLCLGRGRFLEGFPSGVCDYCLDMIKITTNFIKDCEKAQEKLQKMFFGTSQQMVDSFEEGESCEAEPEQDFEGSFAVPETVISFDDSTEFGGLKHEALEIGGDDPLVGIEDDDEDDDDDDDDNEDEDGLEPGEVKYVGHQMGASANWSGQTSSSKKRTAEEGEVHCNLCGQKFNRKRGLKAHMESIHEKKTFSCRICGKTMGWRKTLQRHMKSHEEGYYKHKCELCDKTFSRPSHLKLHMSKHTGEKVRCPLCGNGLRCNYKLGEHLTKVHKLDPQTAKTYVQTAVKTYG
uniref:Zinc finger protein 816 n=1 Tax=Culex pipiens TaxID=7175 RepID=A0A8D8DJF7_CULPI